MQQPDNHVLYISSWLCAVENLSMTHQVPIYWNYVVNADKSIDGMISSPINESDIIVHRIEPPYTAKTTTGVIDGHIVSVSTHPPSDIWHSITFVIQAGITTDISEVYLPVPSLSMCIMNDVCPICLEPAGTETCARPAGCSHGAHMDCLGQWFTRTCCICRVPY